MTCVVTHDIFRRMNGLVNREVLQLTQMTWDSEYENGMGKMREQAWEDELFYTRLACKGIIRIQSGVRN